jgi:hypothetical protein
MREHNRNGGLDRRDELVLGSIALIVALMVAPALLGVL